MKSTVTILTTAIVSFAVLLVAVALVVAAAIPALAQGSDTTGRQLTDFTDTLSVPGFDSSLGELAAAELTISGAFDGRVLQIVNESGGTADFTVSTNVRLCADRAAAGSTSFAACASSSSATALVFEASVVEETFAGLTAGASAGSSAPHTASDSATLTVLDPDALAAFAGVGAIDFTVATLAGFQALGGGGNSTVQVETYADVTLGVDYRYAVLEVVKLTNGVDTATVEIGAPVEWTYDVTNRGNTPLVDVVVTDDREGPVCTVASLDAGATERCTLVGVAGDDTYTNIATATAVAAVNPGVTVSAEDPSGYVIAAPVAPPTPTPEPTSAPDPTPDSGGPTFDNPTVDIEFHTNGVDADEPTGPVVDIGEAITWTYLVTNTGTVDLVDLVVGDDHLGGICTSAFLGVAQTFECTQTGTAVEGQDARVATVNGSSISGDPVTDRDPTHHFGGDEVLGTVITPSDVPVTNPVPDEVLAVTGDSGDGAAALALVVSGLGLVLLSASESLRRRHTVRTEEAERE